jgi:diguanylate cyclase (GGDEF)-like protein/PAS domain S-box-containing protein
MKVERLSDPPADDPGSDPALVSDEDGRYRSIFENAVEGIYQTTVDGRYLRVNPALARMYGYDRPAHLIAGLTDIAKQLYVDPRRREAFARAMAGEGVVKDFEAQVHRQDGSVIWIEENARCVRDRNGDIIYYEGMVTDISARKASEEQIRLLATVFESVSDGILVIDRALTVCAANPAFTRVTGQDREHLIGRAPRLSAPGFEERGLIERICRLADDTGQWRGELGCVRPDYQPFAAWVSVTTVRNPDGRTEFFVLACSDITERKQQEDRIRYQANFDALTNLPNRRFLHEQLDQAIRLAAPGSKRIAVAFLDLDRFKQINDSLGHRAGDALLKQVGRRLRSASRATDIVGRYGGDEFVMIFPNIDGRFSGSFLAEKLLYSFSDPFQLPERELFCLPSIGIAFYPDNAETAEGLIRCADLAMYHTKRSGPRRYNLFSEEMQQQSSRRLDIEHDLRHAIQRDEFVMHYQSKFDLETGRVVGAEALVRWTHPSGILIPPGEFIPIAEEAGLIAQLGELTLRQACRQTQAWRASGLLLEGIAVNLSAREFYDSRIVRLVREVLDETGLPPEVLELELTEGAMMIDMDRGVDTLRRLKALGVRLAIDDFGTGYSSLAYLKRFPIDTLKIDRSFVHDVADNATDTAIIDTIIGLACSLGFSVVAEGVETMAQALVLRERNCRYAQGFLICRPMPAAAFAGHLRDDERGQLLPDWPVGGGSRQATPK